MNTYKAFYKGRTLEITADNSVQAQRVAAILFRAGKRYEVTVILLAAGERAIVHRPQDILP